ncbi:hypothetical protein [Mycobacterium intracellulare]|uniref:hypothetical protein n=1 Tax=Mycobacterium intracellulare TaxID=1767 RepID=UPI0012FE269F|nr:hypothetical protein [Mycobacterium intracellulare]
MQDDDEMITIYQLPEYWRKEIRKLRVENSKMRRERNDRQTRLDAIAAVLQAEPEAAQADV